MPYGQSVSPAKSVSKMEEVLIWLREDLMGELEAINQYQVHIDNIDDPEIKDLLAHIRDDEKEHVAEITHLIARIDAIQREKFAEDHTMAEGERIAGNNDESKVLTVGSMMGK